MGTAGPLRLASDILDDGSKDPFFVLNRFQPQCLASLLVVCPVECHL